MSGNQAARNLAPVYGPVYGLAAIGACLGGAQWILIEATRTLNHDTAAKFAAVAPLIALLALPAFCALIVAFRQRARPPAISQATSMLTIVIVVGLAMRLAWFGVTPPLEDDYQRYLWDGAVVAQGANPYTVAPLAALNGTAPEPQASLARQAPHLLARINFPDLTTIYPATAQAVFGLAAWIKPFSVDGLRALLLLAELATLGLMIQLLRALGVDPLWSALYWWNPLIITTLIGQVHMDALVPPLVLAAALATASGAPVLAVTALGLAAGVKIWPVLLMPVVAGYAARSRQSFFWTVLIGSSIAALVLAPVVITALGPAQATSGLHAYANAWANNNAPFAWLQYAARLGFGDDVGHRLARGLAAITLVAIVLTVAWRGLWKPRSLDAVLASFLTVTAATFYLAPAQFPWYAAWFLPLAAVLRNWPLLAASATLPIYYLFFPLWALERGDLFFFGVAALHAAPVFVWLALEARRSSAALRPHAIQVPAHARLQRATP